MTPEQYVAAWKRFVHVLHGEGEEAKQLEQQMKETWPTFTLKQQSARPSLPEPSVYRLGPRASGFAVPELEPIAMKHIIGLLALEGIEYWITQLPRDDWGKDAPYCILLLSGIAGALWLLWFVFLLMVWQWAGMPVKQ